MDIISALFLFSVTAVVCVCLTGLTTTGTCALCLNCLDWARSTSSKKTTSSPFRSTRSGTWPTRSSEQSSVSSLNIWRACNCSVHFYRLLGWMSLIWTFVSFQLCTATSWHTQTWNQRTSCLSIRSMTSSTTAKWWALCIIVIII